MDNPNFASALQAILTKGIDAASSVITTKLQVQSPYGVVVGPNGQATYVGQQGATAFAAGAGLTPILLIGGVVVVAALLLARK